MTTKRRSKTKTVKHVGSAHGREAAPAGSAKTRESSPDTMAGIGLLTATVVAMLVLIAIVAAMSNRSTTPKRESVASKPIQASASYEPLAVAVASKKPSSTDAKPAAADSTYVGCLRSEGDGQKLVLTEVGGKDVPQSRNWKTMFVTKKSAKLEVRPAGTLALRQHVGQTVQVSGRRVDDRIAARSVKVVGATCS
jgi:hypothetical protein